MSCAGIAPMSSPSNMMTPSVLSIRRMTMVEVVDLPQPDSPTRPTLSPRSIEKLMPSTARKISGSGARLAARTTRLNAALLPLRGYSLTSFSTTRSGVRLGAVVRVCAQAAGAIGARR